MKTLMTTAILVVVAVSASVAIGQSAEQRQIRDKFPVSMDARRLRQTGTKENTWKTDYGSFDKEIATAQEFQVSLRSRLKTDEEFTIEAVYMAVAKKRTFPWSKSETNVTLRAGTSIQVKMTSPIVKSRDTNYAALCERYKDGAHIIGAIIRLKKDGVIIRTWTSSYPWTKMSWQPEIKIEDHSDLE